MSMNAPTFPDVFDEFSQLPVGTEVKDLPTFGRAKDLARCFQDLTQLPAEGGWRCFGVKIKGGVRLHPLGDLVGGTINWVYGMGHAQLVSIPDADIARLTSPMQVRDMARTTLIELHGIAVAIPE